MQYFGVTSKITKWSVCFQGKPFSITVIQVFAPTTYAEKAEVDQFYEDLLELTLKKSCILFIMDWNVKARSQKIPGVTGKFDLGVQNKAW